MLVLVLVIELLICITKEALKGVISSGNNNNANSRNSKEGYSRVKRNRTDIYSVHKIKVKKIKVKQEQTKAPRFLGRKRKVQETILPTSSRPETVAGMVNGMVIKTSLRRNHRDMGKTLSMGMKEIKATIRRSLSPLRLQPYLIASPVSGNITSIGNGYRYTGSIFGLHVVNLSVSYSITF